MNLEIPVEVTKSLFNKFLINKNLQLFKLNATVKQLSRDLYLR